MVCERMELNFNARIIRNSHQIDFLRMNIVLRTLFLREKNRTVVRNLVTRAQGCILITWQLCGSLLETLTTKCASIYFLRVQCSFSMPQVRFVKWMR